MVPGSHFLECGSLLPLCPECDSHRTTKEVSVAADPSANKRLTPGVAPSKLGEAKAAASCRTPNMRDWPHSPLHRLAEPGAYIVTAGTYLKRPIFRGRLHLEFLCDALLDLAEKYQWGLQAWAVFPNHYHFVAMSPQKATSLTAFTKHLHSLTAIEANRWQGTQGTKVWFQFRDTALTYPRILRRTIELCASERRASWNRA